MRGGKRRARKESDKTSVSRNERGKEEGEGWKEEVGRLKGIIEREEAKNRKLKGVVERLEASNKRLESELTLLLGRLKKQEGNGV